MSPLPKAPVFSWGFLFSRPSRGRSQVGLPRQLPEAPFGSRLHSRAPRQSFNRVPAPFAEPCRAAVAHKLRHPNRWVAGLRLTTSGKNASAQGITEAEAIVLPVMFSAPMAWRSAPPPKDDVPILDKIVDEVAQ